MFQISELKSAQIPSSSALKNTLIDPAINLIIIKLKKELEATKTKVSGFLICCFKSDHKIFYSIF